MLATMKIVEQKVKAIVGDGQLPKEKHVQVWSEIWAVLMEENAPCKLQNVGAENFLTHPSSRGKLLLDVNKAQKAYGQDCNFRC